MWAEHFSSCDSQQGSSPKVLESCWAHSVGDRPVFGQLNLHLLLPKTTVNLLPHSVQWPKHTTPEMAKRISIMSYRADEHHTGDPNAIWRCRPGRILEGIQGSSIYLCLGNQVQLFFDYRWFSEIKIRLSARLLGLSLPFMWKTWYFMEFQRTIQACP